MVQFLSIIFFLFLQFLLGFSKVPVFLCHPVLENRHHKVAKLQMRYVRIHFTHGHFEHFPARTLGQAQR